MTVIYFYYLRNQIYPAYCVGYCRTCDTFSESAHAFCTTSTTRLRNPDVLCTTYMTPLLDLEARCTIPSISPPCVSWFPFVWFSTWQINWYLCSRTYKRANVHQYVHASVCPYVISWRTASRHDQRYPLFSRVDGPTWKSHYHGND